MNQLQLFCQRHDSELTDEKIFGNMENFDWLVGNLDNMRVYFKQIIPRLEKIGRHDLILDAEKRLKRLEEKW